MGTEHVDCASCESNEKALATYAGPWTGEPNRVEFRHAGLPCILHRGPSGAWCGYVGVAPGHPLHGKTWSITYEEGEPIAHQAVHDLEVHGGITYAEKCTGHVCHVAAPGEPDDLWWLGFDCAHGGDVTPSSDARLPVHLRGTLGMGHEPWAHGYWTEADVRAETARLAEQIAALHRESAS